MNWTIPATIQSVINLLVLVVIGLAAFGKLRDGRFSDQKEVIDLRTEQVKALESRIEHLQSEMTRLMTDLGKHVEMASLTESSLRGELSELQRLNLNLQVRLEKQAAAQS